MFIRVLTTIAMAVMLMVGLVSAQSSPVVPSQDEPQKKAVRVDEFLGTSLPTDLEFQDHMGATVNSAALFANGKPTILTFVYYRCPAACTLLLNGLTEALKSHEFQLGRDFNLVTISVDSRETMELATAKRDTYIAQLPSNQPHDPDAWRFFTGSRSAIESLTNVVGYRFVYNPDTMQYDHPSVLMFVSPTGRLKRYLYGSYFQPDNVRFAFLETAEGELGTLTERMAVRFYDFGTPEVGRRYVLNQQRLALVLIGGSALLGLFLWLMVRWIRPREA